MCMITLMMLLLLEPEVLDFVLLSVFQRPASRLLVSQSSFLLVPTQ